MRKLAFWVPLCECGRTRAGLTARGGHQAVTVGCVCGSESLNTDKRASQNLELQRKTFRSLSRLLWFVPHAHFTYDLRPLLEITAGRAIPGDRRETAPASVSSRLGEHAGARLSFHRVGSAPLSFLLGFREEAGGERTGWRGGKGAQHRRSRVRVITAG